MHDFLPHKKIASLHRIGKLGRLINSLIAQDNSFLKNSRAFQDRPYTGRLKATDGVDEVIKV